MKNKYYVENNRLTNICESFQHSENVKEKVLKALKQDLDRQLQFANNFCHAISKQYFEKQHGKCDQNF